MLKKCCCEGEMINGKSQKQEQKRRHCGQNIVSKAGNDQEWRSREVPDPQGTEGLGQEFASHSKHNGEGKGVEASLEADTQAVVLMAS
jgi:hypothetical protein